MNEVYVIEFEAYHHRLDDEEDRKETRVFGVMDTEKRGICYLRRFITEEDDLCGNFYDATLKTIEKKNGIVYAEAYRRYKNEREVVTETLYMRHMELNNLKSPNDEVIDTYC